MSDKSYLEKNRKITIIKQVGVHIFPSGQKAKKFLCRCHCGKLFTTMPHAIKSGNTKSCGCIRGIKNITHNMCKTKIYTIWVGMKYRCNNKNDKHYKDYGGRGIKVCKRWNRFENFFKDMGDCPKGMTIERINNNGNYSPKNCKWATILEQANNRRGNRVVSFNGDSMTVSKWVEKLDLNDTAIRMRLHRGWSIKRAFTQPLKLIAK